MKTLEQLCDGAGHELVLLVLAEIEYLAQGEGDFPQSDHPPELALHAMGVIGVRPRSHQNASFRHLHSELPHHLLPEPHHGAQRVSLELAPLAV